MGCICPEHDLKTALYSVRENTQIIAKGRETLNRKIITEKFKRKGVI